MTAVREASQEIERLLAGIKPRVAIVLGSGMEPLAALVQSPVRIPFADIPGFPSVSVDGHAGELVAGTL